MVPAPSSAVGTRLSVLHLQKDFLESVGAFYRAGTPHLLFRSSAGRDSKVLRGQEWEHHSAAGLGEGTMAQSEYTVSCG